MQFPDSVSISALDDELVLLDSASGKYYALNATAARMVELLQQGLDLQQCTEILADQYNAEPETIYSDIEQLISDLSERGLIVSDSTDEPEP